MNIGSKVVCTDDTFEAWVKAIYVDLPVKNEVYTIRDIQRGVNVKTVESNPDSSLLFKGNETVTILLEELVNGELPLSKLEMGFNYRRFAPINEETVSEEVEEFIYNPKIVELPTPVKRELEFAA